MAGDVYHSRETDRVTIERTFEDLVRFVYSDEEVKSLAEVVYLHVDQQYESVSEGVYRSAGGGGLIH